MEQSFLKLYDEFADVIYRHCYFKVSSREVAEDLVQEAFMRVWNYLAKGEKVDNPKAFLYRIAGNLIVDYYRKKKETSLDKLADDGFNPVGDDESSIVDNAEGKHAIALINKLELPYREVLVMRYVDSLSIPEIANTLEESENVVSVRIHRGIEKLKKLLHYEKTI